MSSLRAVVAAAILFVPSAGFAEEMTFVIANSHEFKVQVEMYSQDRDHVWPGDNQAYILDDSQTKNITLSCNDGEIICYGAWIDGDSNTYWGVGPNNTQACDSCCYVCDGGSTENINLVE